MTQVVAQLELALKQQQRKRSPRKLQFQSFNAFWNRVITSGLTQKDKNEVEVNPLPEDVFQSKQIVDVLEEQQNDRYRNGVPAIQLAEMKDITDDLSFKSWITNGCRGGGIFHVVLKTGQKFTVKGLYKKLPKQEFLEEVSFFSELKHENVIELVGYCVDGGVQVLVYEYATRGSLHDILHGRRGPTGLPMEPGSPLSWVQLINIVVGAANGLLYFHEKSLIHCSFKPSNILLFDNEIVKISELHLSDECLCAQRVDIVDGLRVGCGYHPPGYGNAAGFTQKGDIYNFGVLLLELLTGRKSLVLEKDLSMIDQIYIIQIVDARFKGDYPHEAAEKIIKKQLQKLKL